MSKLLRQEILYRLLTSKRGVILRQIVTMGTQSQRVARAASWLRENFREPLRVDALAIHVSIGVFTLHHHFRALTGLSPLQFQLRVDEWKQTLDVNIKGVKYGIAAALPWFKKQGHGYFIHVSSIGGIRTIPNAAVYCGTKFAVGAITDFLRQELAPSIRTTVVLPNAIATEPGMTIKHEATAAAFPGLIGLAVSP